jgi:hypothetical protein
MKRLLEARKRHPVFYPIRRRRAGGFGSDRVERGDVITPDLKHPSIGNARGRSSPWHARHDDTWLIQDQAGPVNDIDVSETFLTPV